LAAIRPDELLLVSDFDGTLADIVPEPTLAKALPDSLHALRRLAPVLKKVVLLSSRTNPELNSLISVPGALVIGDSGLPSPTREELHALKTFNAEAAKRLGTTPGAWIEIKPSSSAVHFRNAPISGQEVLDREIGGAEFRDDAAAIEDQGAMADLGDLLEDQRGVEHRQAQPAIFLRHRHAEHPETGQRLHVFPGKRAIHIFLRVGLELPLSEVAHRHYHPPLLFGELEVHCLSLKSKRP